MKKEEREVINIIKKQSILIYILMVLVLISCIISLAGSCSKKDTVSNDAFKTVGISDVVGMFKDGRNHVVYIGRETCDVCNELLPTLKSVQEELGFVTSYVDITNVNRLSDDWLDLVEVMDLETNITVNNNGKDENVNDTFGNILNEKGYTPCILVIKDNELVAGFFGLKEKMAYKDWLIENGI